MTDTDDTADSQKTYAGFIATLKWTVPVIALIVLFVVLLIA